MAVQGFKTLNVPDEVRKAIKIYAAQNGITVYEAVEMATKLLTEQHTPHKQEEKPYEVHSRGI